jgi:outer membrane lipoprotein-sorting protein
MKTNKIFLAVAATMISFGAFAQSVDEIAEKHVAALGGADKIKGVKTIVSERSLAVNGMEIPSKTLLVVGKAVRSESTVMGNTMVQVVDGSTGWMIRPTMMGGTGEPEDMPADMVKQSVSQLDPFGGLVDYKEKGYKVELIGTEKVDKKDAFHLKLTSKDGQVMDEWLDAQTYLISKVKVDMAGQQGEISFSDYKETDGIKFAKTMDITSPQGVITFITNKVVVNGPIDEAVFKRPAAK